MTVFTQQKRARFRQLHPQGSFILPNPWDVGGVRRLERLGARTIAISSAAFAWSQGLEDGPNMRAADLATLGVRRVSTGFGLASAAWAAFEQAASAALPGESLPA